ncbi:MAG: hypothetical protein JRE70_14615 [Deltaproteobacteria bacterium]|jgi:hypothetical protein|nr:hypothetical protein [Deltaproteobacteria bacterium]
MATATDEYGKGFERWSLQAWLDYLMVKIMMGRVGDVIPKTYMPILRLVSEDVDKVDDAYQQICALREPVRLLESPRDKWRKTYGAYIRELEWVLGELRQHFPTREYQDLVIDIMARNIRGWLGAFLPSLEKSTRTGAAAHAVVHAPDEKPSAFARIAARGLESAVAGRLGRWLMDHMNPAGFMVGPVETKMGDHGELTMFIPRCYMHTAPGDGKTQDQACVQTCKGACEQIFNVDTPAHMHFEPHLPDYSCTLRIKLGGGDFQTV